MSALSLVLLQVLLIIVSAQVLGALAQKLGQSKVTGEIIAGILLGPTLFGQISPDAYHFVFLSSSPLSLSVLGEVGLILLMFQIGLEFDKTHLTVRSYQSQAVFIALAGLGLPFIFGLGLGWHTHARLSPAEPLVAGALFCGIALSVTALPVLVRMLTELGAAELVLGRICIVAAAITDVLAWIVLAVVIAVAKTGPVAQTLFVQLGLLFGYLAVCWFVAGPALRWAVAFLHRRQDRIRLTPMALMLVAALLSGMTTSVLGFHSAFGGLVMGLLLSGNKTLVRQWHDEVAGFVHLFLLPLFFAMAGSRAQLGNIASWHEAWWFFVFLAAAIGGKFGGCYLAAIACRLDRREARVIGALMNTRGLMELVVLNIGLEMHLISVTLYSILVFMAIATTMMTVPLVQRWWPVGLAARSAQGGSLHVDMEAH